MLLKYEVYQENENSQTLIAHLDTSENIEWLNKKEITIKVNGDVIFKVSSKKSNEYGWSGFGITEFREI